MGEPLLSASSSKRFTTQRVSLMRPLGLHDVEQLGPGQVGCVSLGMKRISEAQVTFTPTPTPLPNLIPRWPSP